MAKISNTFDSTSLLQYMFPKDMLKYFEITNVEEEHTGKYDETKTEIVFLHVYMDERDLRDEEWHDLKPNGFTEARIIHDFPLRELKVVLHVRRRRWLAEDGGNVILNRIPLAAEGTGYSAEFAAFLKEALGYIPGDGPFRWSLLQDMREQFGARLQAPPERFRTVGPEGTR